MDDSQHKLCLLENTTLSKWIRYSPIQNFKIFHFPRGCNSSLSCFATRFQRITAILFPFLCLSSKTNFIQQKIQVMFTHWAKYAHAQIVELGPAHIALLPVIARSKSMFLPLAKNIRSDTRGLFL